MYLCLDTSTANELQIHWYTEAEKGVHTQEGKSSELLQALDVLLQDKEVESVKIKGIAVLVGKGAFTATRLATTLANTWHFVHKIPVQSVTTIPQDIDEIAGLMQNADTFIHAQYSGDPNIGTK